MTDAISSLLLVAAFTALPAALFTACTRRGLPETLRRAGLAFYCAADAWESWKQQDEAVFVKRRVAR